MLLPALLHWRRETFFSHNRAYFVGLDAAGTAAILYSDGNFKFIDDRDNEASGHRYWALTQK